MEQSVLLYTRWQCNCHGPITFEFISHQFCWFTEDLQSLCEKQDWISTARIGDIRLFILTVYPGGGNSP